MKALKILIVEDVVLAALDLRKKLEQAGHTVTAIARTMREAIESVADSPPDLAIIDIVLEGSDENGIETSKKISSIHNMPVIYLTGNSESQQFILAQKTRPAAYLLKPFNRNELLFNVELAYHNFYHETKRPPIHGYMMLPTNGGLEMIQLEQVQHLKAEGVYAQVILANGTRHMVSTGLKQLEQYFDQPNFFRLSRSYIINLHYIKQLKGNELLLIDHQDRLTRLLIPDVNRKELLSRFNVVRTKSK